MPIVDETIIREIEEITDYEYQFSHKFEHKMVKLIWKEAHPWINVFYILILQMKIKRAFCVMCLNIYQQGIRRQIEF